MSTTSVPVVPPRIAFGVSPLRVTLNRYATSVPENERPDVGLLSVEQHGQLRGVHLDRAPVVSRLTRHPAGLPRKLAGLWDKRH
jgi:hypothetical protein